MKKTLFLFMIVVFSLMFSAFAVNEIGGDVIEAVDIELDSSYASDEEIALFSTDAMTATEYLYNSIYNRNLTWDITSKGEVYRCIDLRGYDLDIDELHDILYQMIVRNPELMIYNNYVTFSLSGKPVALAPNYIIADQETSDIERDNMIRWVDAFIATLPENASVEEQLLELTRFVSANVEYCYSSDLLPSSRTKYTGYSAYKYKTVVCQGYTAIATLILRKLGIETGLVRSELIDHVWNYVVIDGKKYHLDLTWCDTDNERVVYYEDFLVSDATRDANIRSSYEVAEDAQLWVLFDDTTECSSQKYESGYIWNWYNVSNIKREDAGYTGTYACTVGGIGLETPRFFFGSIKLPNNKIYLSDITDNDILYLYGNSADDEKVSVYVATYDEDGRMLDFYRVLSNITVSPSAMKLYRISRPDAYEVRVFCVSGDAFSPFAKNSVMK